VAQERLRHEPNSEDVRRELLEQARKLSERFVLRAGQHRRPVQLLAARSNRLLGDLLDLLGSPQEAEQKYAAAAALFTGLLAGATPGEGVDYAGELAGVHINRWTVLEERDPKRAGAALDEAERVLARASGEGRPRLLACLLNNKGIHLHNAGQVKGAGEAFGKALEVLEGLPAGPGRTLGLARTKVNLAALWIASEEGALLARARQALEGSVRDLEALVERRPERSEPALELGRAYTTLARVLDAQGDAKGVEALHARGVELFGRLARDHERMPDYRHLLAVSHASLGQHFLKQKQPARAEEALREARALLRELAKGFRDVPLYRQELARASNGLGLARLAAQDERHLAKRARQAEEAEEPFEEALDLLEALCAEAPWKRACALERDATLENLILCHDTQLRLRHAAGVGGEARHLQRLTELRRRRLTLAEAPPDEEAPLAWAGRLLEEERTRAELARTLRAQARLLVSRRDHAAAARVLEELTWLTPAGDERTIGEVARLLARCLTLARQDSGLSPAERAAWAGCHGWQLLGLLERAVAGGCPGLARLLDSRDLDPLRKDAELGKELRRIAAGLARRVRS
jgi:hypothetical protein